MSQFIDRHGKSWRLSARVPHIRRLREECGIDLSAITDEKAIGDLMSIDPEKLVSAIWILLEEKPGSFEEFADLFDGPSIERAVLSLIGELISFFPRQAIAAKIRERLPKILGEMDRQAIRQIDSALSDTLTSWQGSSE